MGQTIVEVPGHGEVEFPDTMSDVDIVAAIKRLSGPAGPKTFAEGFKAQGSDTLSGLKTLGGAVADIPRLLLNEPRATLGGFVEGAKEGGSRLLDMARNPVDSAYELFAGVKAPGNNPEPTAARLGRGAFAAGATLLGGAAAGGVRKALAGARVPPTAVAIHRQMPNLLSAAVTIAGKGAGKVDDVARGMSSASPDAVASRNMIRGMSRPAPVPGSSLAPTSASAPSPIDEAINQALRELGGTGGVEVPLSHPTGGGFTIPPTGVDNINTLAAAPAPVAAQPLIVKTKGRRPGNILTGKKGANVRPTLSELRSSQGAERAARDPRLRAVEQQLGVRIGREGVQDIVGGPSRTPLSTEGSALDSAFRRLVEDERGAVSPQMTADIRAGASRVGGLLSDARIASMLSGLAIPKSALGNLNAVATAAVENGSTSPIRSFLSGQTLRDAGAAFTRGANPSQIGGPRHMSWVNMPGRIIGALDESTQNALVRSGLTEDAAQRLLLTRPNAAAQSLGLGSPIGRTMFPFQRTPFNQFTEGMRELTAMIPGHGAEGGFTGNQLGRRLLTAGSAGAGAAAGQSTDDPRLLGLAASAMGVRGLPFLLGAAFGGAGKAAVSGATPIPEWGIPSSPKDLVRLTGIEPAFERAYATKEPSRRSSRRPRRQ